MKKNLYNLLAIMMMVLACVMNVSCDKDDDKSNNGNGVGSNGGGNVSNVLVGSWKCTWDQFSPNSFDTSGWQVLTFNADGTGTDRGDNQNYDRNGNKEGVPYTWNEKFRYKDVTYDSYLGTGSFYRYGEGQSDWSRETFTLNNGDLDLYPWRFTFKKQ